MAKAAEGSCAFVAVTGRQAARLLAAVWVVNALLIGLNVALAAGWQPHHAVAFQLDMDKEASFGAWYPSVLLFLLAVVSALHFAVGRGTERGQARGLGGWRCLSILALLLSADEVCGLHERLDRFYSTFVGERFLGLGVSWTLLLLPFIALSAALLLRLCIGTLRENPTARALALAGLGCWMSAVALEMLEWAILGEGTLPRLRAYEPALEEGLELAGTTLLLHATLASLFGKAGEWRAALLAAPAAGSSR